MNKILSVVIPTFNMEKYLGRCLHSCIADLNEREKAALEVIVVNDGSKDKSLSIAKKFQKDYPEVFTIIDKQNGNYGSCINAALKIAQGKYIKILDADDWFDGREFLKLVDCLMKGSDVDLVLTNYQLFMGEKKITSPVFPVHGGLYKFDECMPSFPNMEMHFVTYKVSILRDNNYKQTEGIFYTDQEWIFYPMLHVKTIEVLDASPYCYFLGRPGQSMDPQIVLRRIDDQYRILDRMLHWWSKQDFTAVSDQRKDYLLNILRLRLLNIYKLNLIFQTDKDFDPKKLSDVDECARDVVPELYRDLNDAYLYKFIPIKYIKFWRTDHLRLPLWMRRIYIWFVYQIKWNLKKKL